MKKTSILGKKYMFNSSKISISPIINLNSPVGHKLYQQIINTSPRVILFFEYSDDEEYVMIDDYILVKEIRIDNHNIQKRFIFNTSPKIVFKTSKNAGSKNIPVRISININTYEITMNNKTYTFNIDPDETSNSNEQIFHLVFSGGMSRKKTSKRRRRRRKYRATRTIGAGIKSFFYLPNDLI